MGREGAYLCPLTGDPMAAPVAESQNLMVLSKLHDTMVLPVGSKQTPVTMSVWPVRVDKHDPEVMSHVLMVSS